MGVFADFYCLCYPDWALFVLYLLLCEFIFLSKTILIVSSIIQYFYWMCTVICEVLDDIFKWFNSSYPYLFYCNETRACVVILLKPELLNSLVENKQKRQKAFLPYFPFWPQTQRCLSGCPQKQAVKVSNIMISISSVYFHYMKWSFKFRVLY